jgi:hypothetical protein
MNRQNKIIFLIGRDNWQKDDSLNHILINHLKRTEYKIKWEDPAGCTLYKFRNFENHHLKWLPDYIKIINLRAIQIFYGICHWNYFNYLSDRRNSSVELRIKKLKKSILRLGTENEIVILSRSAGGRFSSRIADELNIKHVICLSYPFKHPDEDVDPDRYLHLMNLQTPMLIIQGESDEYGGLEVRDNYILSRNIELFFVDTYHDFKISNHDWERVLSKIDETINDRDDSKSSRNFQNIDPKPAPDSSKFAVHG